MSLRYSWLLATGLLALAGCASADYEQQMQHALTQLYGTTIRVARKQGLSADPTQTPGNYLVLTVDDPALVRHFPDLTLPASRCAFVAYHSLAESNAQPNHYAYYQVNLVDSAATHTYTYSAADLALAEQACTNLATLVGHWQQRRLSVAAAIFHPSTYSITPPDSSFPLMQRAANHLAPISTYQVQGWRLRQETLGGQSVQLVQLLVVVPHPRPRPDGVLTLFINPTIHPAGHFLYALRLLE